jgi:hypothetical protein
VSQLIEMRRRSRVGSNTWAYQHAFQIRFPEDVPPEFCNEYRKSCDQHGLPIVAFFSPTVCTLPADSLAASPPRIVLLFPDVLKVLTITSESTAAVIFEVKRSRFFAHGIAEFMLDCWFTVYYSTDALASARFVFPGRAAEFYRWLSQSLWTWSTHEAEPCDVRAETLSFFPLGRWPHKFSHFLQTHPEINLRQHSFLQTALSVSKSHTPFWPNLLLASADDKIVVLCDQYDSYPSKYGLEATFLPLAGVKLVAWVERAIRRQASIAIDAEQQGRSFHFSWPACTQLKSSALNWIDWTNSIVAQARPYTNDLAEFSAKANLAKPPQHKVLAGDPQQAPSDPKATTCPKWPQ